jgi:putative DNA primase/helicase
MTDFNELRIEVDEPKINGKAHDGKAHGKTAAEVAADFNRNPGAENLGIAADKLERLRVCPAEIMRLLEPGVAQRDLYGSGRWIRLKAAEAADREPDRGAGGPVDPDICSDAGDHAYRPRQQKTNAKAKRGNGAAAKGANGDAVPEPEPELSDADCNAEIQRLAKLSLIQYERQREAAAACLTMRSTLLDRLVTAARGNSDGDGKQGRALNLPEPEQWPDPVDGADLLDDLSAALRRHVVMHGREADTAALWVVHSYLLDNFGISPRLAITSPEKQCGKTTLLDVLACLVWRRLPTANVTAAAIFRVVDKARPTLLIDEADTFLPDNEELRGILNAGHRRGGFVTRTVGDDHEPRQFSTYSACALALIGHLPSTLTDRSVSIELRRRRQDESVETFRLEKTGHLDRLARRAARWAADNADRVRGVDPDMPDGLYNRTADNWRPLLAIADTAGGEWPGRARRASDAARAGSNERSAKVLLLGDIRAIFAEKNTDRLFSEDLIEALKEIEGHPWAEWKGGKPITKNGVARLLGQFTSLQGHPIIPVQIRIADRSLKGYRLADFADVFERYL